MNLKKLLPFCCIWMLLSCEKTAWETVAFESMDGLEVTADLYQTGDKTDPLILLFHQSTSSRGEYRRIAPLLRAKGFNCLAVDLRWGKQDFWDKIPNETAERSGAISVIDNYEDSPEYRKREVWPRMLASVQDMEAAVSWATANDFEGKLITWGSSFSAMLQFKQVLGGTSNVDGMISFSPGEYNESDTTMLSDWVSSVTQPVLIIAGSDSAEYEMTRPQFEILSNERSSQHWVKKGRHGSSILLADSTNWEPVWQFLHQFKDYGADDYLAFAKEAEIWMDRSAIEKEGFRVLLDAVDEPEKISTSFSDGMAGQLTFYLELYEATKDESYLLRAKKIGAYLQNKLPQKQDSLKGKFWAFSPYGSVCGPAFALTELFKVTGDMEYRESALTVVEVLDHFADNRQDTLSWDLGNDLLGGLAGTGLFLLYTHKELKSDLALEMATKAGETLIGRAIEEADGYTWKRGQNSRFILPNFSHGPAGIGYFLASLYEVTEDEKFLRAALKAVTYLDSIAKKENDVYLIPYGFPDPGWRRAYDVGWAHGPAGVARLFIKLHQITGEKKWLEKAEACWRGILASNPMGKPHPDFGEAPFTIDQRFGLAGVASFAQDMHRYTGKKEYLDFSKEISTFLLSKSNEISGRSWPIARFGFMANAGQITEFSGYFYGTVGLASVLLQQHNLLKDIPKAIRFVDDPF